MSIEITWDGTNYIWDEGWMDEDYQVPPTGIQQYLNREAGPDLAAEDDRISDPQEWLDRAKTARDACQWKRALDLVLRVMQTGTILAGCAAVLSSILRRRQSKKFAVAAIAATELYHNSSYAPVITTRAAAFCDLCEYALGSRDYEKAEMYLQKAQVLLSRAFAVAGDNPTMQFAVHRRLDSCKLELDTGMN
jgi:hypothetical protein